MKKWRMIIDIGMTAVLLGLMAYSLIGELTHEILGTAMIILSVKRKKSTDNNAGRCPAAGVFRRLFYCPAKDVCICFRNLSAIGVKL